LRGLAFRDVLQHSPATYPDTIDYRHVASLSLSDPLFWTYWKPWGLPLLWKALPGATTTSAPLAHWSISIVCWLVLAFTVATSLRHGIVRIFAFCSVLAFSLTPLVAQWDGVLLTESLSASLTALLVATLLLFVRSPGRRSAALLLGTVFFAAAVRDVNAYLALVLVCPVALAIAVRGDRRRVGLVVVSGVVLTFGLSSWTYNIHRWETPMQGVIAARILVDKDAREYFTAHGMPIRPGLASSLLSNRIPPSRFDEEADVAYFRPWFIRSARSTYARYLLTHPGNSVLEPLRSFDQVVAPTRALPIGLDYFRPQGFHNVLPAPFTSVLYTQRASAIIVPMILTTLIAVALIKRRLYPGPALVGLIGIVSAVPLAFVVWNGDRLGVDRHSLVIGLIARLSVLLVVLLALDAALTTGPEQVGSGGRRRAAEH